MHSSHHRPPLARKKDPYAQRRARHGPARTASDGGESAVDGTEANAVRRAGGAGRSSAKKHTPQRPAARFLRAYSGRV